MHVQLITPEGIAYKGDSDSVTIPTVAGEITVLPGHIPLIGVLAPGSLIIRSGLDEKGFAIARGVVDIGPKHIRILSDIADTVEVLDEAEVERARERALKLLSEKRSDVEAFAEAQAVLEKEVARLKTVRRRRPSRVA